MTLTSIQVAEYAARFGELVASGDDAALRDPKLQALHRAEVAALRQEALGGNGWTSAYVGGGVLEFHFAGRGYSKGDIDMVVADSGGLPVDREELSALLLRLGWKRTKGRHWTIGNGERELLLEVPGYEITPGPDRVSLASGRVLTLDPLESVLLGRVAEFFNTGNASHALQAVLAFSTLGERLNL